MKRPPLLLTALLLGGCAYYNGLYNAERLVRSAEKAEREGRTGEASGYWGEAAVKAETVLARFPTSKWADPAVKSKANCVACHPSAEQGSYER